MCFKEGMKGSIRTKSGKRVIAVPKKVVMGMERLKDSLEANEAT